MSSRSLEINVSKISGAAEQFVSGRVAIEEPLEIRLGYYVRRAYHYEHLYYDAHARSRR